MRWEKRKIDGIDVYLMYVKTFEPAVTAWVEKLKARHYRTGGRCFTIEEKYFTRLKEAKDYCAVQFVEWLGYLGDK